jgi:hypothetical protein
MGPARAQILLKISAWIAWRETYRMLPLLTHFFSHWKIPLNWCPRIPSLGPHLTILLQAELVKASNRWLICHKLEADNDRPTTPSLWFEIVGYIPEHDSYKGQGHFCLPQTTENQQCLSINSLRDMSNSRRFRPALLVWPFVAHQYCQGVTCIASKEGWEGSWQASTHEYNNISNIFSHPDSAVTHASRCHTLLKINSHNWPRYLTKYCKNYRDALHYSHCGQSKYV